MSVSWQDQRVEQIKKQQSHTYDEPAVLGDSQQCSSAVHQLKETKWKQTSFNTDKTLMGKLSIFPHLTCNEIKSATLGHQVQWSICMFSLA